MSDFRFTHLHVHSQYSLLDGKASIKELVDAAVADGMHGLALTDHGKHVRNQGILQLCQQSERRT